MTESNNPPIQQQPPKPSPTLRRLDALVGEWNIEITLPADPPIVVRGWASFEWLEGGAFVAQHSEAARADFPKVLTIIGCDDSLERYSMLYFDSRGVSRIYQMSLSDEAWKLWREAPGFSQRFTGTFGDKGNTITARWEKSSDGSHWEHDFDLTYRKVKLAAASS